MNEVIKALYEIEEQAGELMDKANISRQTMQEEKKTSDGGNQCRAGSRNGRQACHFKKQAGGTGEGTDSEIRREEQSEDHSA